MIKVMALGLILMAAVLLDAPRVAAFEADTIPPAQGDLKITFIGHGTLMFEYGGRVIHVDPWTKLADYNQLPKADLILVTHAHPDHLDPLAIKAATREGTELVVGRVEAQSLGEGQVMKNGDQLTAAGFPVEAVPAYNLVHKRDNGQPFHPRGEGNGYVIDFGGTRVYVAGDTENIPEMKALENIAAAFLPMNLPYTMTPEMTADAARSFNPKILYPYHYGQTDPHLLANLLEDSGIEVRLRPLQ
jgi:L-ascorbate metabolism protein UlaG (beta-lactamase superfamily)